MLAQVIARLNAYVDHLGDVPRVEGRLTDADLVLEGPGLPASRVDRLGRVARVSLRGLSVRRTFSCDLQLGRRPHVEILPAAQAAPLYDATARFYHALAALYDAHPERFALCDAPELGDVLARAARFDAAAAAREAEHFAAAYPEPVEILPPDRYRDVVVKPAVGCPNAGCSFCAFYAGKRFRPLSATEFSAHLDAVSELFGPLLSGRTGVFLGSASAASLSDARLLDVLALLSDRWPARPRGVATFLDPDHAPKRGVSEWQRLGDAGLTRVVSGLETGLPALRERLGKSADVDAFVAAVAEQKRAGLPVGLTVLAGIGRDDERALHIRETARVVEAMALTREDLVYVSPVVGAPPADGLSAEVMAEQSDALRVALKQVTDAPVAPYTMHRFGYFA